LLHETQRAGHCYPVGIRAEQGKLGVLRVTPGKLNLEIIEELSR
jgi:hypothetical protein